jgi:hypothetical protein
MTDANLYAVRGPQERKPGFFAVDADGFVLPGSDGPLSEDMAAEIARRFEGTVVRVDAEASADV